MQGSNKVGRPPPIVTLASPCVLTVCVLKWHAQACDPVIRGVRSQQKGALLRLALPCLALLPPSRKHTATAYL